MQRTDYPDNEYLIHGLQHLSHDVFELVFKTYYSDLYRLAYAYCMDKDFAEDLVQEVFVSLWSTARKLPENTCLRNFLYSSVKYACLDYLKHLQVIDSNKDKLTEALIFSGNIEYEDQAELWDKVKEILQTLPQQQRRVLELKVFKGMNYKEIAQELHISEASVHTYVKRAYKYLRDAFPLLCFLLRIFGHLE